MAELVTKRYATALFEIAKEKEAMGDFEKQVQMICDTMSKDPELMQILEHPHIIQEEKIQVIEKIFIGRVYEELVGLLVLIVRKNRQSFMLDILNKFLRLAEEDRGQLKATVTSAVTLTNEQIAQIKANLAANTGKTIELETAIDESIIGGMILHVGDKVVDGSIKGKLNSLKSQLSNLRLA